MNDNAHMSFAYIYETFHRKCFLFAKSYVHNNVAAEDIASESLIKLWEISKTQTVESPMSMLYVIVRNKALDYLKHLAVSHNALGNISASGRRELELRINTLEASDPDRIFAADIEKIIRETLASLPEKTRRIFEMYRMSDVSKKEIANVFNISVKGVDYHLSVAMDRLRGTLKDYYPLLFFIYFH